MTSAQAVRPRWRRLLPWLRWGTVALLALLLSLDLLFPLPLPTRRDASADGICQMVLLRLDGSRAVEVIPLSDGVSRHE